MVLSNRILFSKSFLTLIILVLLSSKELSLGKAMSSQVFENVCFGNSVSYPRGGGTRDLYINHQEFPVPLTSLGA